MVFRARKFCLFFFFFFVGDAVARRANDLAVILLALRRRRRRFVNEWVEAWKELFVASFVVHAKQFLVVEKRLRQRRFSGQAIILTKMNSQRDLCEIAKGQKTKMSKPNIRNI